MSTSLRSQPRHRTTPIRLVLGLASVVLLAACDGPGSFSTFASGDYTSGAVSYRVEVAEGEWQQKILSGAAPEDRAFWHTEVKVTNDSDQAAPLFTPAMSLTIPASEAVVTPSSVQDNGLIQTALPAQCTFNMVQATVSQTTHGRLITTQTFDGMPDGLCVFTMQLEGIRGEGDDGDAPVPSELVLDPGESRILTYASATYFAEGEFPDMQYFMARTDVFDQAQGEYQALQP